jgi:hypothetical protein
MKTPFRLFLALPALTTLILAGCAAGVQNVAIDEGVRAQIHTVRINPVVAMPEAIGFYGQSQGIAALAAGPFAGLLDDKLSAEPKARLTSEIQQNHIDVPAMVAASFAQRASAEAGMQFAVGGAPADAQLDLTVNRYGFATAHPGAATLYPVMAVSAVMKNARGEVVWQGSDLMSALNPDNKVGHPLAALLDDPEQVRHALATGSDLVAVMLTHNLMGLEKAQNVPGIQK